MKKFGLTLWTVWTVWASVLVVNAAEPGLGDRRLFFSGQERRAMAHTDDGLNGTQSTSAPSNERRRTDNPARSESEASVSKRRPAGRLPDRKSDLVVNGFIEASGYLTLFVNGKPCQRLSLVVEHPQEIHCDPLQARPRPSLSLVQVDAYQFAIEKADGNVIFLDRRIE